ncbi:hypothetical protein L873DRAFT_1807356 [Choiromyces venosus 120613-1]|uniref:Peptidase S53 activation domain-containing protein n=1 Tax=Choiromyces venosus 120613-1 TaxID=1336337 RepID=A0A3N4JLJ7_9PEZI|nr:hypothetical protein L873DRAFT_1807356 [Choiromyces venosus 120613-1]
MRLLKPLTPLLFLPVVHAVIWLRTLTYEPFDTLSAPPFPWEELRGNEVPPGTKITLHMPLAYADLESYERRLLTSNDPDDLDYGKYMTPEEVDRMLGPTNETYETVMAWLKLFGIPREDEELKLEYDWLTLKTTVGKAEELLKAKFRWYVNRRNRNQITLRCLEYSLPKELKGMIRFVQPTTLFATRLRPEDRKELQGFHGIL